MSTPLVQKLCCGSGTIFFESESYFSVGFRSKYRSCFGSYINFYNILDINLPLYAFLVSVLSCSFMTWYKLFRGIPGTGIFLTKKLFIFLNWAFLSRNCQILSDFKSNFPSHSFRIWSCSDPDPELIGSGFEMIFSGSGSCHQFRIRPDPDLDSQQCEI